ncbi:MAG: hypothetical protein JST83_02930 [Bacteroidetes bacterium]|nr:hypothetical protein [Bacteroidota bacterium]
MKVFIQKIITALLFTCYLTLASAQTTGVPQRFSYTTQVTDSAGNPVANTLVTMRATLTTGSPTGPAVYTEINSGMTSPAGIFTIVVGGGLVLHGNISSVPWVSAPVYLSSAMDVSGGGNFIPTGSAQLISQPYAIVSGNGIGAVSYDHTGKINISTVDSTTVVSSAQGSWLTGGNAGLGANAYIGTNDNTDLVLKQNGTEGLRLSSGSTTVSGSLGIGTGTAPLTAAQVNGALALQDTVVNISGNVTLNVSKRSSFLINSSVSPNAAVITLTDGVVPGQLLMIMVSQVNSNNGVSFAPGSNLRLSSSGNHNVSDAGVISFIWNGTQWLQSGYSRNN